MLPESALMTRRWQDRDLAFPLAKSIFSWAPPITSLDTGPCTGSASILDSGSGSGTVTREWRPCGDDSSDTDGTIYSDSDGDPEPHKGTTAVTSPANVSALPAHSSLPSDSFVWIPPFWHSGSYKQTCPACPRSFSCGAGVRPDCADRGRKHVIMSHSEGIADPRHLALALSIRLADPDYNNFRTSQVAPDWAHYHGTTMVFAGPTQKNNKSWRADLKKIMNHGRPTSQK